MRSVRSLYLDSTRFSKVDPTFFGGLSNLENLHLTDIGITTLSPSLKPIFLKLKSLKLEDNAFHCNCEMIWFKRWATSVSPDNIDLTGTDCSSPMKEDIRALDDSALECTPPKVTDISSKVNIGPGAELVLSCTATGDPAPVIQWDPPSGISKVFNPSHNRTILSTRKDFHLTNVRYSESGVYRCLATNLVGNDSSTSSVDVSDAYSSTAGLPNHRITSVLQRTFLVIFPVILNRWKFS